ncbi:MAG: hypothetical protein V4500_07600 [Pseudomonadota bacterium]
MNVIAAPGIKVPKETQPHDYIDDGSVVDVPDTAYYQRRLLDGDLLLSPVSTPRTALKAVPTTNLTAKE